MQLNSQQMLRLGVSYGDKFITGIDSDISNRCIYLFPLNDKSTEYERVHAKVFRRKGFQRAGSIGVNESLRKFKVEPPLTAHISKETYKGCDCLKIRILKPIVSKVP